MGAFILGVVVGVLINLFTALFSRQAALKMIPWLLFYVAVHGCAVLLNTDSMKGVAMTIASHGRSYAPVSTIVVMLIAAVLAGLFWRGVNLGVDKLAQVTSPSGPDNSGNSSSAPPAPQPPPSSSSAGASHTAQKRTAGPKSPEVDQAPPVTVAPKERVPSESGEKAPTTTETKSEPTPTVLVKGNVRWTSKDDTIVSSGQALRLQDNAQLDSTRMNILRPELIDAATAAARVSEFLSENVEDQGAWDRRVTSFLGEYSQCPDYEQPIGKEPTYWFMKYRYATNLDSKKKVLEELLKELRSKQRN